ncbi:MAG: YgeY family selenium metabolism-linked hydrolase [bacterium]|nr:YgeY family selenium metabolism-linked hydrolase [bacterium]
MQALVKKLSEQAEHEKPRLVRFLRELIAIPSLSGNEKKVVDRIKKEMNHVGFDTVWSDKFGNIIGQIGIGKTKILYDAHIDTVGIGNRAAWQFDPFKGKVEDGNVYGLGASDNKGAIASMVYAGKLIKQFGLDQKFTLYVVGSVQEEDCDGLCYQYIFGQSGLKPDYVVLGEATNLDIYRGHRGRMEIQVTTSGVSCHASAPERGVNAIYQMTPIIQGIEKLNRRLKSDKFLGKGTVVVTKIECQTASINAVPNQCTIYLDRRLTIGETKQSAVAEIKSLLKNTEAKVSVLQYLKPSYTGYLLPTEKYFPTWVLEENHPLVQIGVETATLIRRTRPKLSKWIFSTNGVTTMGRFKIPTIGFGPGNEIHAHTSNDHIPIDHLVKAVQFYALFPTMVTTKLLK